MMGCTRTSHQGGCFCGAIRYRVDGPIESVAHCHCNSCRRSAGAAFVTWFTVGRERLGWTKGGATQYPSSPGVIRGFCGTCGTELTYSNQQASQTIDITLGSLDCAAGHPADRHIWTADKLEWLHLDEQLPAHEGWSTDG
jgi:hypothetical protein